MKKLFTTAIALIFLCAGVFATSINSIGRCGDMAFLRTSYLKTNSYYEVRAENTDSVLLRFTVGDIYSDSTIKLKLPPQVVVEMRHRYAVDSLFGDWIKQTYTTYDQAEGCTILPIGLSDLSVSNGIVRFNSGNESNTKAYNIQASVDAIDWVTVESIKPDGSKGYTSKKIPKPIGGILTGVFIFGLLVTMFDRENKDKSKHRKYLSLIALLLMVGVYSCKKESVNSNQVSEYKFVRVQQVNIDGSFINSNVLKNQ